MITVDELRNILSSALEKKGESTNSFASRLGIQQASLWRMLKGRHGISFEFGMKILEELGYSLTSPESEAATIRRLSPNAPVEVVGANVVPIHVYAIAGAGSAKNIIEIVPLCTIGVPESYASSVDFALQIDGESMYPTIKNGAIVGVKEKAHFRQNEVFAVSIPYEDGYAIKRVAVNHVSREYILRSDNFDQEKYFPIHIPIDEAEEGMIVGRVMWVWQNL